MNPIEKLVREAKHPMALTGAGISAPSGIPTFQGSWKNQPIRNFLTREFFHADPVGYYELFMEMVGWCDKEPNLAHKALAALDIPVVTQNIDGLHEKAGTRTVYPLHGTLHTVHCSACGKKILSKDLAEKLSPLYEAGDRKRIMEAIRCPDCGCWIDTDVVLYGDQVQNLYEAMRLAEQADLMLVIGTSLVTYPAASLPEIAKRRGARIIVINDDCVKALEGIVK